MAGIFRQLRQLSFFCCLLSVCLVTPVSAAISWNVTSPLDLAIAQDVGVPIVFIPSPGDFDRDLDVDGGDFLVWQRGGSPISLSQSDLDDWESNFGAIPILTANSLPVPEPVTSLLLVLGLLITALGPTRRLSKAPNRHIFAEFKALNR